MPGKLRVTQVKSTISHIARNRATIKALGLHGIGSSVEVVDNEATRGMVRQVRFLVTVEELPGSGSHRVVAAAGTSRSRAETASREKSAPEAEATPAGGPRSRARAGAGDGGAHVDRHASAEEKA